MKKIVSAAKMAEIDRITIEEYGIPGIVLMENAGIRCWQEIKREIALNSKSSNKIVICAGKGNNGGDALVIARQAFTDGFRHLWVIYNYDEEGGPQHHHNCRTLGISMLSWKQESEKSKLLIGEADWIVDGVMGTGISGEMRGSALDLCQEINASPATAISVDIPSGLGDEYRSAYPSVRADLSLCIGLPKRFLYLPHARKACGEIRFIDIGFPKELTEDSEIPGDLLEDPDLPSLLPEPEADTYKNKRGTIAVFGGAPGFSGAPCLAADAAARARAGLVTVFADSSIYSIVASKLNSVMVRPWVVGDRPDSVSLDPFDAVIAGPGWSRDESRIPWLRHLIDSEKPAVLDADGLNILSEILSTEEIDFKGNWVLTPHPGELSRLLDKPTAEVMEDPISFLLPFSERIQAVVILKSHISYIAAPDGRYRLVDGMNPAMATGGSGDVLSGIIGAFLAAGESPWNAASEAALLHQRAGRRAFSEEGWFLAEDLPPYISLILKEVRE